ncbi:MAG: HD domain-containing protein, partial [Acidobacteriota bacterium]
MEIRCPVYGFIPLDEWEREIISQPPFQRLRRIRQLSWTDYVYPGAMHTRFEHSIGVMHMATMLYDAIVERAWPVLRELGYGDTGRDRYRKLIRLAALLHDVGHGPFSHAAEELTPFTDDGKRRYRHEEYSTAIIRHCLKDVIEKHPGNNNFDFRVDDVAGLIEGGPSAGRAVLWQELVSGQIDADRMDYLLRDSYHCGVEYGRYDWRRIVGTIELIKDVESGAPRLGISEAGRHAAEGLILARYMMFNQVYFHKTRVILDEHFQHALADMLPGRKFPKPTSDGIGEYIKWDDWRVLGALAAGGGGEHGERLRTRDFYRQIWA